MGFYLTSHSFEIFYRFSGEEWIAGFAPDALHILHPKVIGVRPNDID